MPADSRERKSSTQDSLFAETFNTNDSVSACISFNLLPDAGAHMVDEVHTLVSLRCGLNGHPGYAHGGALATFVDEVMGTLLGINEKLSPVVTRGTTVTAYLNLSYVKPVQTPRKIWVTARSKEVAGKKHFLDAVAKGEDGTVLTRAKVLFVETQKFKLVEKL